MPSHRRKTKRQKKNAKTKIKFKHASKPPAKAPALTTIYWPDRIDYVKAVAAQGLSDTEMAQYLGVSADLLDSWKAYYPLFAKAIEEGRSQADVEVIQALHKNAVGYTYETDVVVRSRAGADVITAEKYMPPDTNAQKFWLANRSAAWRQGQNLNIGGQSGKPVEVKVDAETKMMVIHSILNMITPRPDGDGKAPKLLKPA